MEQTIKSEVPLTETSVFSFSKTEFLALKWEKFSKEFSFNSEMYDIIRIEKNSSGSLTIFAVNDKREKAIVSLLENHAKNNSPNNLPGKNGQDILKYFNNIYQLISNEMSIFNPSRIFTSSEETNLSFNSFLGDVPSPPPKQV